MTPTAISRQAVIAALSIAGILLHLALRFWTGVTPFAFHLPLYLVLGFGGSVVVAQLAVKVARGQFGSDLLAGISIVTSVLLGEYLAGSLVVLMLSGGQALEEFVVGRASAALQALAQRMPSVAHRHSNGTIDDVPLDAVGGIL